MNNRHHHSCESIPNLDEFENRLQVRLSGRIQNLHIIRQDRGLILHGRAHTYYAKQVAQHAIMAETDVPILANEIEVA